VTDTEILVRTVRTEDETKVIYIEDDFLKMRNENGGKYPAFIKFHRVRPESNC